MNDPRAPAAAPPGHLPPAIARLFRRSLGQGQLHPLLPLLLHYRRQGEALAGPGAAPDVAPDTAPGAAP